MMRRCSACGMFFDAEQCPGDHSHITNALSPDGRHELIGRIGLYADGKRDWHALILSVPNNEQARVLLCSPDGGDATAQVRTVPLADLKEL